VFERPREFSVQEIMRLAPAGDIDELAIGISTKGSSGPKIWGLAPDPRWEFPLFTVHAPGFIEVRRYHRTVFTLSQGSISTAVVATIYEGFINEVFPEATDALLEGLDALQFGNAFNIEWFYSGPLLTLLRDASRHGHGATVFVIPDALTSSKEWRDLVRIKYSCHDHTMWAALRLSTLHSVPGEDNLETPDLRAARRIEGEWPERVARLTRVDGGLLMTDRFRLLGFGVEVVASAMDLKVIRTAEGTEESIDQYGTRHRSAMRFCYRYPKAVAFVCSQDGGIKCIRSLNGVVTLWK
jgi:hypothetical protein